MPYLVPTRSETIIKNLNKRCCIMSAVTLERIQAEILKYEAGEVTESVMRWVLKDLYGVTPHKAKDKSWSICSIFQDNHKTHGVRVVIHVSKRKAKS